MKFIDAVDIKPTQDANYHLVTVPAELAGYETAVVRFNGVRGEVQVRPTGAAEVSYSIFSGGNTDVSFEYVAIDANNQFEIRCNKATECWLIGGFSSTDATSFTGAFTANEITPVSSANVAENIDISSHLGGDTAIAAIVHVKGAGRISYGHDLSTEIEERLLSTNITSFLIPVTSGQVRLRRNHADTQFFLTGYVKSGLRLNTPLTNTVDNNNVISAYTVTAKQGNEDIVWFKTGNSFSTYKGIREVGSTFTISGNTDDAGYQAVVRLDANDQVEILSDFASTIQPEWFATNDTGTVASITDIDGDNNVQAGQTGAVITTVGIDPASVTQTVTLGGEALTITSWS